MVPMCPLFGGFTVNSRKNMAYCRTGNFCVQKFLQLPAYNVLAILFTVLIFAEEKIFCSIWCARELWRAARQSAVFGDTTCIKESGTLLLGKF